PATRAGPARASSAAAAGAASRVRLEDALAALDAGDALHASDGADHLVELLQVRHLDHEHSARGLVLARHARGAHVDLRRRDRLGDVGEQRRAVLSVDHEPHREGLAAPRVPFHRHLALGWHAVVEGVGTVEAMDRDAAALRDHANDAIAWHRLATAGEMQ